MNILSIRLLVLASGPIPVRLFIVARNTNNGVKVPEYDFLPSAFVGARFRFYFSKIVYSCAKHQQRRKIILTTYFESILSVFTVYRQYGTP